MRFLFTTIPERGHINPLIGVAQHLEADGHTLAFCAEGDLASPLRRAGLSAQRYEGAADRHTGEVTSGKDFAARVQDGAWLRGWIRRLLVEDVPRQLPALRAAMDDFRPDVLVNDPMLYGPILIAAERGLPWAGLSSSLNFVTPLDWQCALMDTVRWLSPERERLFVDRGQPPPPFRICDAMSPFLNGVFTIEDYAPRDAAASADVFYLGPSRPRPGAPRGDEVDFPWGRLRADRPLVYLSFGSQLFHQPALFAAAISALGPLGVQLVLAMGDLTVAELGIQIPEFAIPVRYAPQLHLLPRASLMISHGGANSIGECLAAGVPLLLLPQCNDQPLGARFLLQSGAGLCLSPEEVSVSALRSACQRLLAPDGTHRRRARALGTALAARDGAKEAAALLLSLAAHGIPLLPKGPPAP